MEQTIHQEAFNLMKPESTLFIISRDKHERPNVMVCNWGMKCSHEPPLFAIAVSKTGFTHKLIQETKEFVIAVPSKKMEKDITIFGSAHGDKKDKLKESGVHTVKATQVKCPLLKDATINMECILHKEVDSGDHIIFIGKIVATHINPGQKVLMTMKTAAGKRIYEEF